MKKFISAALAALIFSGAIAIAAPEKSPLPTDEPVVTAIPAKTSKPEKSPDVSQKPNASQKPGSTDKPSSSGKPDASKKPETSGKPDSSQKPGTSASPAPDSESKTQLPVPRAKSAIVIDANSGDVIYSSDSDRKVPTAGISNIMTAVIALENSSLADSCQVTEEALSGISFDQPQLGMKVGETYTVEQLLYAILLNSDNDAANVLAVTVGGSIEGFVQKMNDKAQELELSGTHFANPCGQSDENHYTTAADVAYLAQYAMRNSNFTEIVKTPKYVFPPTAMRSSEKTILSTNHLISRYKYPYHYYANAAGIKSANSTDAGYCLVSSAVKNKLNVISVLMGCDNTNANEGAYSFVDTKKILDYIFENYQSVLLSVKGDVLYDTKVKEAKNATRLALTVEEDVYATMKNTADSEMITTEVNIVQEAKAPIAQGDYFGTVTYLYGGKPIKTANLVAANEVKRDFFAHIFGSIFGFLFHPITLIILILLIAVWVRMKLLQRRKRMQRRRKLVSQNGTSSGRTNVISDRTSSASRRQDNTEYRRRR